MRTVKVRTVDVRLETLILDYTMYPRTMVSSVTVAEMAEALVSGSVLPPILVQSGTNRIIDGYHRYHAYKKAGHDALPVVYRDVEDDAEFYCLAVGANSTHGRRYTPYDRALIIQRATELAIPDDRLTGLLHITRQRVDEVRKGWFAETATGEPQPLKRTVAHMSGRVLTTRQVEANRRLSGMQQAFYVNQLLELIDSEMLDWDNPALMDKLETLRNRLNEILPSV